MKILHIVHQFAPHFVGGTELNTAGLAAEQMKNGHDVAIFVPAPITATGEQSFTVTDEACGRVFRVPVGERSGTAVFRDTLANSGLIADALQLVLDHFQPDLIHIQHLMGLPVRPISRLLKAYDRPIVITLLDFWWSCANAQLLTNDTQEICDGPNLFLNCGRCAAVRGGLPALSGPALSPVLALRNRWLRPLLQQADGVLAPTRFVADWYAARFDMAHPIEEVALGFEQPSKRGMNTFNEELPASELKLAYVGGLSHQKGVHVIIEAIKGIETSLSLTIGGDESQFPDYVAQLKQAADGRVTFKGKLKQDEVQDLMAQADLLLVPSLWYETYAIVVSEAFAAGIPVLVSDLGALAERVEHQVSGLKAPAGDVVAWRDQIRSVVENRSLLQQMAGNAPAAFTMHDHFLVVQQVYNKAQSRHLSQ